MTTSATENRPRWAAIRFVSRRIPVNAANQYSSRTVPNKVDITGEAHADATVTINDQPTTRHGTYFHGELQIDNTADAAYQAVTNMAILNQTASDLMSTNVGYVYVPKNPEAFQYDADGNLTSDGRWTYFWDAENRLIMMKAIKSNLPDTAWKRLEFAYDYQGRRIQKRVFTQLEGGTAVLDLKFFYDGWNLLAEVNTANQVVRSYVWGLDLSGSVQGAGGVGGLLMVKEGSGQGHFVGSDGNGNVVTLVNASSGAVSARYEYGPFGEPIRATGPMAKSNPFRFSTKYTDNESDLVYYGFRYYNPSTGRWPNRDPIGERGGLNLYSFVGNDGINHTDPLGLEKLKLNYITSDFGIKDWLWAGGPSRTENLIEILADVKAKIGKNFDADGKCGNCVLEITITSHSGLEGYVGFSPAEGASYGQSDYYSPGSGFSNPGAAAAFAELGKYFCKGGKLYLQECNAGGGDAGTATLQDLSRTIGVPVTAPQVAIRVGRVGKCTKTSYPDGRIETTGDCNSTFCIKKPRK